MILFGAFDRHNLGDLLFPHLLARWVDLGTCRHAGLATRDLRRFGGHRVARLADLPIDAGPVVHVGGELLTCTAWQAAVMLVQPPEDAAALVPYLEARPTEQRAWVRAQLGLDDEAPYVSARSDGAVFVAVGGVALDRAAPALRDEVLAKLRRARAVTVRDRTTLRHLQQAGIPARLLPDAAVTVARLWPTDPAPLSGHYLAVQCSQDLADDASLDTLATQLQQVIDATGWPVVLLRAGAAPWHDNLGQLHRLAGRLSDAQVFDSLQVRPLCALIGQAAAFCGTSLHGRLIALAHGRPRVTVATADSRKHEAFVNTWEMPAMPGVVALHDVAVALRQALATNADERQAWALQLQTRFDAGIQALLRA